MDYGHPLKFGTFISPTNAKPQAPVALAQLSEKLGYDLVTFQDHPYQPAFLDTWTLMTWVAATTSTIRISPNVLNLPLRPAPVTARAAASLDLLSGGRFELGLGAGGFWDAIEGMGGTRLTPGQAVDALSEGIDIIREIWDVEDRSVLRGREHYTVNGAKRGPAPAHRIPIWIGAAKPRMLRLTGRKADGWLPSYAWMKGKDLIDANAAIDEAASGADRDPAEITRLLNIGGDLEAEEIIRLVLDDGMSTFIVASDSPAVLERFADTVMPAVREAVAAERASSGVVASSRSASAIALRAPGIRYDELPDSLKSAVVEPGDFGYRSVKSTYLRGGTPGIVVQPTTVQQVVDAVGFARQHPDVPLGLRSGGHGISGRSTNAGGIVLDLGKLDSLELVDEATRRVRFGPGARWMEVAAFLEPYGWALSSGDYGGVGVGGLATAGGIGYLGRKHGLTLDHLVSADIVLADGSLVTASATENTDLFWAIRGAGANFGVVVSFEFEVYEVGSVGWAQLAFDASDTAGFLERFGAAVEAAPRELTAFLILGGRQPGQPQIAQIMAVVDSDDAETIIARLQPLADIGPLLGQSVQLVPYASIMANASDEPHGGQGEPYFRSALVDHVTPEFAAAAARLVESGASPWFQLRSVGGAVSDVPEDATAYAHRSAAFSVAVIGNRRTNFDEQWEAMREHFDGLYISFESDTAAERIQDAFPPATLSRLRELKRRYDPQNLFRDNFNIVPAP